MMADAKLTRSDQLAAFFVNKHEGWLLGRTRLMKLMYLADHEARRYLGRPISDIKYVWYHYGPYDRSLKTRIGRLRDLGVIQEECVAFPTGNTGYLYRAGDVSFTADFTPAEIEVLSFVSKKYMNTPLEQLLDEIVYQTEPMAKAQKKGAEARNKALDMDVVNGVKARELSASFDELIERSAQVRTGDYLTHADAMGWIDVQLGTKEPANVEA
jgi:hypothetical protein